MIHPRYINPLIIATMPEASTYSYDERNFLLQVNKGSVMQIRYTYDEIGNFETITDKSGATTGYTFDKSSQLKTAVKIKGGERFTVSYVYNGDGLRTKKTVLSSKEGNTPILR